MVWVMSNNMIVWYSWHLWIACRRKTVLKVSCLMVLSLHSHRTHTVQLIAYWKLSTTARTCLPLHWSLTTVSSRKMKSVLKKRKVWCQSFARCSRELFADTVLGEVFCTFSVAGVWCLVRCSQCCWCVNVRASRAREARGRATTFGGDVGGWVRRTQWPTESRRWSPETRHQETATAEVHTLHRVVRLRVSSSLLPQMLIEYDADDGDYVAGR